MLHFVQIYLKTSILYTRCLKPLHGTMHKTTWVVVIVTKAELRKTVLFWTKLKDDYVTVNIRQMSEKL